MRFLRELKKINMRSKIQDTEMANPIIRKALNFILNELSYKSAKKGKSSNILAKFATYGIEWPIIYYILCIIMCNT